MTKKLDYVWVRKDKTKIDIRGVDEWYLKSICNFVAQGHGYSVTESQIRAIYEEMENRGLKPMFHVKHALAKWQERRDLEMAENSMLDVGDYYD